MLYKQPFSQCCYCKYLALGTQEAKDNYCEIYDGFIPICKYYEFDEIIESAV